MYCRGGLKLWGRVELVSREDPGRARLRGREGE